ncbi:MAG: coenzyme F420-0:L-glutamate ligase [Rhizobiales bacterium]|nr:coenzyme F420-0:L-glutamate ligase [Hyphomicrobiales bacterium]
MAANSLTIEALEGLPEFRPGVDLAGEIVRAAQRLASPPQAGDVIVVTQKIVSKAEGRFIDLDTLTPSPEARRLAASTMKDPQFVEAVLMDTRRVVRAAPNVLVVETSHGIVLANAGLDQSNLPADAHEGAARRRALRLPADPDASAARLREALERVFPAPIGVVVSDSVGRAWRIGTVGLAIGVSGMPALLDMRGMPDMSGRRLEVTMVALADQVAAAANLVIGEAAEGTPAARVRGLAVAGGDGRARDLLRPANEDLFR